MESSRRNRFAVHLVCGWAGLLALVMMIAGCSEDGATGSSDAKTGTFDGIEKSFERGPVKVVVRVSPEEPTIADRIELAMEVTADENYTVDLPRFGEKLDHFGIRDFSESQPRLVDGNRKQTVRTYELEPFLSGDYLIPPMKFTFRKKADPTGDGEAPEQDDDEEHDDEEHVLETEDIKVTVRSLLQDKKAELKIHEIAPPVSLEAPSRAWLWWSIIGGIAGLMLLIALIVWMLKRKRGKEWVPPPVPAHVVAFEQLEALVGDDLPRKGQIKEFYQRISDILRRYIENRFEIQAPEQTTEEFLDELRDNPKLPPVHQGLLKQFLQHCDLVKFAEHEPTTEDIQSTFDACKNFIIETQAQDVTVPALNSNA